MNCQCCKNNKFLSLNLREDEVYNLRFKFIQCLQCKVVVSEPIPNKELLSKIYSNIFNYNWYKKVKFFKNIQAKKRFFMLKKYFYKDVNHLDVGCNYGYFVEYLRDNDINSYGYDISLTKEQKDSQNYFSDLDKIKFKFDVITLFHSLEHVPDINYLIKKLENLLNYDGKLIIFVPNYNSIGQKIKQKDWVWLQQPYIHIWQFSEKNLKQLLINNNLKPILSMSKDTWDAQIYDYTPLNKISLIINRVLLRKVDIIYIDSIVRVFTLPFSYLLNITLFKFFSYGSELIMIAKK